MRKTTHAAQTKRTPNTMGMPAAARLSQALLRRSDTRNVPQRKEKPIKATATTPSTCSHGSTNNDQIVIAITPRLLKSVIGIDNKTNIFVATDGVVCSMRNPALSRLACITAVTMATDNTT